jgi:hypothetical protein
MPAESDDARWRRLTAGSGRLTVRDRLLNEEALESSAVVANFAMNRERQLDGVNSYSRALGFDPLDWIIAHLRKLVPGGRETTTVGWLDLCCGTSRCLVQAAD